MSKRDTIKLTLETTTPWRKVQLDALVKLLNGYGWQVDTIDAPSSGAWTIAGGRENAS